MRIALLGNSGSGKSSLARAFAGATGWPVLDLDMVAWEPQRDAVPRSPESARAAVRDFCSNRLDWVVEGCYANLIDAALRFQPTLLFLNPGLEVCLANCKSRPWEPHKFASPEDQDAHLTALLAWVADYYTRDGDLSLRGHRACFAGYAGPKRELHVPPDLSSLDSELFEWLR